MRKWTAVGTLALAALLAACADDGHPVEVTAGAARTAAAGENDMTEKRALTEITRLAALALQNRGMRQQVLNHLRESRHTVEHKLPFSTYLAGSSGSPLLHAMAQAGGMSPEAVRGLVASVRPLEFYMPVAVHRSTWTGGADLWIASYLEDDGREEPAVFDLRGARVPLWNPSSAPSTPTLALVPVETDFSRPLPPSKYRNVRDGGGTSVGTYETPECDPLTADQPCDDGGTVPGSPPAGLYMTFAYGEDGVPDGLWGLKGEPEIEMHVFGVDPNNSSRAISLACSHAGAFGYRQFDMNDHTWSSSLGVLLFSAPEINDYYARTSQDLSVMMWEDDDTTCQVKTDYNLTDFFEALLWHYATNAIRPNPALPSIGVGTLTTIAIALADWIKGNDDFVGEAQYQNPGTLPNDATHRLERPNDTYNGHVRLILR